MLDTRWDGIEDDEVEEEKRWDGKEKAGRGRDEKEEVEERTKTRTQYGTARYGKARPRSHTHTSAEDGCRQKRRNRTEWKLDPLSRAVHTLCCACENTGTWEPATGTGMVTEQVPEANSIGRMEQFTYCGELCCGSATYGPKLPVRKGPCCCFSVVVRFHRWKGEVFRGSS